MRLVTVDVDGRKVDLTPTGRMAWVDGEPLALAMDDATLDVVEGARQRLATMHHVGLVGTYAVDRPWREAQQIGGYVDVADGVAVLAVFGESAVRRAEARGLTPWRWARAVPRYGGDGVPEPPPW